MIVTVYTTTMCSPCVALKTWLYEQGIEYREIERRSLDGAALAALRKEIMRVSRAATPSLPAVSINLGDEQVWISNHGSEDITEMTAEILKVLG